MTTLQGPQSGVAPRDVARFPLPPNSLLDAVAAACRALCAQGRVASYEAHRERRADHDATRRLSDEQAGTEGPRCVSGGLDCTVTVDGHTTRLAPRHLRLNAATLARELGG